LSGDLESVAGNPRERQPPPRLEVFRSRDEEIAVLRDAMVSARRLPEPVHVLEAGCGRRWPFELGVPLRLTGIDADASALRIRRETVADLDDAIVGDLRDAVLPPAAYDVIYCSYVLEHVDGAERVLRNFAAWLRPGGVLVLRVPDARSVYGAVSKLTPFWFHVLYYRVINRNPNAGKPGYGPYPTFYDPVISRAGIREFCGAHGFQILVERGQSELRRRRGPVAALAQLVTRTLWLGSLGQLAWQHENLVYVLRKG